MLCKNSKDELLNIAILCKGESFGQNDFFDGLRDSMTGDGKAKGFVADYKTDVLKNLRDTKRYMRYIGSNTVPPCLENVQWIVMASLLDVIHVFTEIFFYKFEVPKDFLIWLKQFKSTKTQGMSNNMILVVFDHLKARQARNRVRLVAGIPNHPMSFSDVPCFMVL